VCACACVYHGQQTGGSELGRESEQRKPLQGRRRRRRRVEHGVILLSAIILFRSALAPPLL